MTREQFIQRARAVHGDKYNYDQVVYVNNRTRVSVVCPEHGMWNVFPVNHVNGRSACPKCSNRTRGRRMGITTEEVARRFKKVHGDKYTFDVSTYQGMNKKMTFVCPKHGSFEIRPQSVIHNFSGCSKCGIESRANKCSLTTEEYIQVARKIHGNKYDYSKVNYIRGCLPVTIICPLHGDFTVRASNHTNAKQGCHACLIAKRRKK